MIFFDYFLIILDYFGLVADYNWHVYVKMNNFNHGYRVV